MADAPRQDSEIETDLVASAELHTTSTHHPGSAVPRASFLGCPLLS